MSVLPPYAAWARLRDMRHVVEHQPAIAHAVRCLRLHDQLELTLELLRLHDQLELTLELLRLHDWPDVAEPEPLPPNVVRFRPCARLTLSGTACVRQTRPS